MQAGLSFDDARRMGLSRLMWIVSEWADMNIPDDDTGSVREATQEDIDEILG